MSGMTRETALVRPPVKGENWEGKLNIIFNYLHSQKKGPLLRSLKRPDCKGEEIPGVFAPNDVWHYGYIRWMGIEIWVKVRGTKKSAKEAAVKEFMSRYDKLKIEMMAKTFVETGRVPPSLVVSTDRDAQENHSGPAQEPNSEKDATNPGSADNTNSLAPNGICILIDLEMFGSLATSRISEILEENEAHPICELKGFCKKGHNLQLGSSFTVKAVEEHLEEVPDVLLSLEVGRRINEFRAKGRVKMVFIVASDETAGILTSYLQNEQVDACAISSEEEFNKCMNRYIERSGIQ